MDSIVKLFYRWNRLSLFKYSAQDTLPLQMLTQQMLNSNFAFGSFIVKHWRSHIFLRVIT